MKIHQLEQGSDEWHELRSTKFTASKFNNLFMKKTTKSYQNTINEVVFARLTGEVEEGYTNEYMKRGIELEPEAIEAYELLTFDKVDRVGFIELDDWVGCSPDGLIGTEGLLQVKCPKATTLMDYIEKEVPEQYMRQIQGELYVTGRKWNDFFVYHPKLKPIIHRVKPMKDYQEEIKEHLKEAIAEAKKRIEKLKQGA